MPSSHEDLLMMRGKRILQPCLVPKFGHVNSDSSNGGDRMIWVAPRDGVYSELLIKKLCYSLGDRDNFVLGNNEWEKFLQWTRMISC